MKTTFTLVRHGQTDWNKRGIVQGAANIPLNDFGIQQAQIKAPFFANKQYDYAFSSPLDRAIKTMSIILTTNNYHLPIETDDRLKERDFGEVEGLHFMYYRSLNEQGIPTKHFENNEDLEKRVYAFLQEKVLSHGGKSLLITAHSHVLKAAHRSVYTPQIDYRAPLDNLAVLVLEFDHEQKNWAVVYYEGEM